MSQIMILSDGIAIGEPVVTDDALDIEEFSLELKDIEDEIQRYQTALKKTRFDLEKVRSLKSNEQSVQVSSIMKAHLQILKDPLLTKEVEKKIRSTKKNAEFALRSIIEEWKHLFPVNNEPFFEDRAKEIQGLSRRVLLNLSDDMEQLKPKHSQPYIVFAKEITATDVLEADPRFCKGFVTKFGESSSHATIIAKAKGICYISNVAIDSQVVRNCKQVIVDGFTGIIHYDPSQELLQEYQQRQEKESKKLDFWKKSNNQLSFHDEEVTLRGSIEFVEELDVVGEIDAKGIGLVRSEFLLNLGDKLLPFQSQEALYSKIAASVAPEHCVLRTLDVSYEEFSSFLKIKPPKNPALHYRGLRWLLENEDIFIEHLRAMVLASRFGNVSIMFPMVTDLSEFLEAKKLLLHVRKECLQQGIPLPLYLPIGTMIEVPAAAILCDRFAEHVDFFALGTSDLMQYTLGIDRGECVSRDLFYPVHPAIIRLMQNVIQVSKEYKKPLSLCGAACAEPKYMPLFLGLGFRDFSISPRVIPKVRKFIGSLSDELIDTITNECLKMATGKEVAHYLEEQYQQLLAASVETTDSTT